MRRGNLVRVLGAFAAVLLASCSTYGGPPAPGSPSRAQVEELLAAVRVIDARPPLRGYERGCGAGEGCVFGPAWTDDNDGPGGHDGCDTRNNVLAKQLREVRFRPGTRDCVVVTGILHDPYTGKRIEFDRSEPRSVQIDHIYSLAAAWAMGASNWPLPQRIRFANDIDFNLLAVAGAVNEDKGDSTPSDWLPPAHSYHCFYAGKYLTAATRYDLPVTRADHEALRRVAARCP
ncbi:HNH endonuclease family protein [Nocardia sp. CDC159]|uniref:HNH endonuclease family protein n=1 Tax=Nocardia pulmonis TaxID=2951408 RepID=A0A9X2ECH5_9NOCA|nr:MULTISPECIES: HNH endonuclease family protein [Nocardia]MCM6777831.1 HNH endonuclease family protein [Nocardia pulmonis]MCM6790715.1 HNH endonuclease family protein [Nocardia sp. CDC159]